eukprot:6598923-Alexandrium_andersonii.AAC.1
MRALRGCGLPPLPARGGPPSVFGVASSLAVACCGGLPWWCGHAFAACAWDVHGLPVWRARACVGASPLPSCPS